MPVRTYSTPTILLYKYSLLSLLLVALTISNNAWGAGIQGYALDAPLGEEDVKVNDSRLILFGNNSIWIGAGSIIEYNDNIELDPRNGKQDIIIRPNIYIRALRPLGENNVFNFITRLGTTRYMKHKQYNTQFATITPDTAASLKMYIREIEITFLDRFAYLQDPTTSPLLNKTVTYKRFENGFTTNINWKVNQKLTLGLVGTRNDLIATDDIFKSLSSVTYRLGGNASYKLFDAWSVGTSYYYSTQTYQRKVQNNNKGQTISWDNQFYLSKYLSGAFSIGLSSTKYKPTGTITDNSNPTNNTIVFNGSIKHLLTPLTTHTLEFSSRPKSGYGTNYYSDSQISYTINTALNDIVGLSLNGSYQNIKNSGTKAEKAKRYFLLLTSNLKLINEFTIELQARYLKKSSSLAEGGYVEKRLVLDITYSF